MDHTKPKAPTESPQDVELFQGVVEYLRAEVDFYVVCDALDSAYASESLDDTRLKCAGRFRAADKRLEEMIAERDRDGDRYTNPGHPAFPGVLGLFSLLYLFENHLHTYPEKLKQPREISEYMLMGIGICRRALAHKANKPYEEPNHE